MHGSIHVLHVDDNLEFLELTQTFLEREDDRLTVEIVTSPKEAMNYLEQHTVDCIVSDYEMPDMNGIEFLQAVRNEYPNLPFLLFTGKGGEEVASDAIAAGVTDYIQKGSSEIYELLANRIINAIDRVSYRNKIRQLHDVALDLESLSEINPVYERMIDAAASILKFDQALIYERKSSVFTVTAIAGSRSLDTPQEFSAEGSLAERTRQAQETILVDDTSDTDYTRQLIADSVLSIPINDRLIFQTGAKFTDAFDEDDIELAELLIAHAREVISRINQETDLKRERDRFQSLFETLPEPAVLVSGKDTEKTITTVNSTFDSPLHGFKISSDVSQSSHYCPE